MGMSLNTEILTISIGLTIGLLLFSLIFGDNGLFRLAAAVLGGSACAYLIVYLSEKVFYHSMIAPLFQSTSSWPDIAVIFLAIGAGALILVKFLLRKETGGNLIFAILLCISVAVVVGGLINGTLIGLTSGLISKFRFASAPSGSDAFWYWTSAIFTLVGAVTVLNITRHYVMRLSIRRRRNKETAELSDTWFSKMGEIFLGVSFGAIFAACFISVAIVLVEQLSILLNYLRTLMLWIQ